MSERVDLQPAFVWECPVCGQENFVRSVSYEEDEATLDRMEQRFLDSEQWQEQPTDIEFTPTGCPEEVVCAGCNSVFTATDGRDYEDDDYEGL